MPFSTTRKCPTLVGFNHEGHCKIIYCGQWSCKHCSKVLARRWANRIRNHITETTRKDGVQWYMLTLTLGSGYKSPELAFTKLKKLWNRLRMAISRAIKIRWQYCAFVEGQPHRQSMPHFHIILNVIPPACIGKKGQVTQHATHNFANRLGWGFEADFGTVTDEKAAWYVAKYVSKGAHIIPRGFRRVRVSRAWLPFVRDPLKRLMVRRKSEALQDYLLRVEDWTNKSIDDLKSEYIQSTYELQEMQQHANG